MSVKLLALGSEGIGPKVVNAALKVLDVVGNSLGLKIDLSEVINAIIRHYRAL